MAFKDSRKEYTVVVGGLEHTLLMTPEAAAQQYPDPDNEGGTTAVEVKSSSPANKTRSADNK